MIVEGKSRYHVALAFPGMSMSYGASRGHWLCSSGGHTIRPINAGGSWDNFNALLASALNAIRDGATHMAMIHSDVEPLESEFRWLDILLSEMDRLGLDLASCSIAIKDWPILRGVCSCGIGDPGDPWHPYKRFTVRECIAIGKTFCASDVGYDGWPLLHNNGLWCADLRSPIFRQTDNEGNLKAFFNFPKRVYLDAKDGKYKVDGFSEDWWFSMRLWELGAKTAICPQVKIDHVEGRMRWPNYVPFGIYTDGDEDTRYKWGPVENRMVSKRGTTLPVADVNASEGQA